MSSEIATGLSADRQLNVTRPVSVGQFAYAFISRNETLFVTLTLLVILGSSLVLAHHKPYWFDEVLSLMIATQPDMHGFVSSIPTDASPPLSDLLIRASLHLFGPNNISARLPSMIAFLCACVAVYRFVRTRCGPGVGYLAMVLMATEAGWAYAFEARPYALVLAFTTWTLVCWQGAAASRSARGWALTGMAFGIAGTMLSHQLGLLDVGLPILCGELVRLRTSRRLDWPLYATFLVALPVLAFNLPFMMRSHTALVGMTSHSGLSLSALLRLTLNALRTLSQIFGPSVLVALFPWSVIAMRKFRGKPTPRANIPLYEIAAATGLLLLVPLTVLAMVPFAKSYDCRYAIAAIAGIGILGAYAAAMVFAARPGVIGLMIVSCAIVFAGSVVYHLKRTPPVRLPAMAQEPGLPILFDKGFPFFQLWWYGNSEQRKNMDFVYDPATPPSVNTIVIFERDKFPMRIHTYDEFLGSHTRFVYVYPEASVVERLANAGFRVTPVDAQEDLVVHIKTSNAPPSAGPKTAP